MPSLLNTNNFNAGIDYGSPMNTSLQELKSAYELPAGAYGYKPRPLADFRTDFTYLRFGKDRPGGGNSPQPYITFPIPLPKLSPMNPSKVGGVLTGIPATISNYYLSNKTNSDYPVRGGGINFNPAVTSATLSSQIDKQRISMFLSDSRGAVFASRQQGLQISNPAMETGLGFQGAASLGGLFRNVLSGVPVALENTRTYNLSNTLRQVGVSGTGYHLVRHGNSPFSTNGNYADTVGLQANMNANTAQSTNRLLVLQSLKLAQNSAFVNISGAINSINTINQLGLSLNKFNIQSYQGGPNSSYGIGNTLIKRATDTTQGTLPQKVGTAFVMTYDTLAQQNRNNTTNGQRTVAIQDFKSDPNSFYRDREGYYGLTTNRYNAGIRGLFAQDDLTRDNGTSVTGNPWASSVDSKPDMIKFGFECINNDNPAQSDFLQFRAYLTNGINDSNQANLSAFKYLGRGEDFFTYQGFSRTISFGFKVVVESSQALKNCYDKLNILLSQIYPDYSPKTNLMRSNIVRLTIGNYIYRMPGLLESINLTVDQETTWQAGAINEALKEAGVVDNADAKLELPHIVNVEVSFKPIFDRLPQRMTLSSDNLFINNRGPANPQVTL